MGAELAWLVIPLAGLAVIIGIFGTTIYLCKQRCKKQDEEDEASDVELQEREREDSLSGDGRLYDSNDVSFRRPSNDDDSVRVFPRPLPQVPAEGQTEDRGEDSPTPPPVPPPPPDVISGGGANTRRDDAGIYDLLGQKSHPESPKSESPYAEGWGLFPPASHSSDIGGPTSRPPDVAPSSSNAHGDGGTDRQVYSVIDQLAKQRSRRLREQEEEGIRPEAYLF